MYKIYTKCTLHNWIILIGRPVKIGTFKTPFPRVSGLNNRNYLKENDNRCPVFQDPPPLPGVCRTSNQGEKKQPSFALRSILRFFPRMFETKTEGPCRIWAVKHVIPTVDSCPPLWMRFTNNEQSVTQPGRHNLYTISRFINRRVKTKLHMYMYIYTLEYIQKLHVYLL